MSPGAAASILEPMSPLQEVVSLCSLEITTEFSCESEYFGNQVKQATFNLFLFSHRTC